MRSAARRFSAGPLRSSPALVAILSLGLLASACGALLPPPGAPTPSVVPTDTATPSPSATATPTPTKTPLPPTSTVTPSPTPAHVDLLLAQDAELRAAVCEPFRPVVVKEGQIVAPILLFHHVRTQPGPETPAPTSRYNVDAVSFEDQLLLLQRLGYEAVTVDRIAQAITADVPLPDRPIAITFDDGWAEQYDNAFRILQQFGMTATFYVPSRYPGGKTTVTWDQLREMAAAGMEIGSHSRTHAHVLALDSDAAWKEISESKTELEDELGVAVTTFAYPFGEFSPGLAAQVRKAGYRAGVGLGPLVTQGPEKLWYLSRVEVRGGESLADFVRLLPWRGEGTALCAGYTPLATP